MKKILVTGGAGFIGSSLCDSLLGEGHEVWSLDNFDPFYPRAIKENNIRWAVTQPNYHLTEGDITNEDVLAKLPRDFDVVIHLAAKAGVRPSIKDPDTYIQTNIHGTANVLEWMRRCGISKLIFASSSSVYGNNKKLPFGESDNVDYPISPYAFTKKACELLIHTYYHLYRIDSVNLRFFTVYGPRQRPDLAIRKFVSLIKSDKPVEIYGTGETGRDYTFITDIVKGINSAVSYVSAKSGVYEIINLGNSSPVKLSELVNTLYQLLNKTPNLVYTKMQEGDVEFTYAAIDKAKDKLGYVPETSLRDGLTKFIGWYEQQS